MPEKECPSQGKVDPSQGKVETQGKFMKEKLGLTAEAVIDSASNCERRNFTIRAGMQVKEWAKRPKTLVGVASGQKASLSSLSQSLSEPSPRIYPCTGSRLAFGRVGFVGSHRLTHWVTMTD